MSVKFERSDNLLKIIIEGEMSIEDMYAGVDEIYVATVPKMVLWHMLGATIPDQVGDTSNQLRLFSEYATKKGQNRSDGRVALLVPTEVQYGLARMSTTFAELNDAAYSMVAFREESEALAWLNDNKSD